MALTREEQNKIIEAYEPIVYFHPEERFFPVKPEAYLQASALWHSQPPSHKKEDWGNGGPGFPRTPDVEKGKLSVNPADDGVGGKTYLGHTNPDGRTPFLTSNNDRELWLDMAAWKDEASVTDTSKNEACNVEGALTRWTTEEPLKMAGDWYYAEVQDLDTLTGILATLQQDGLDLGKILRDTLGSAWFIWYYLLYPIHQENLRGCEQVAGAGNNGDYEGDWNAIGIIVRKPAKLPWEPGGTFPDPQYIGFGRRARGLVENFIPTFRQEMQVRDWHEISRVGRHPKVYVARASHNNYGLFGPQNPPAITPSDASCGATEKLDEEVKKKLDDLQDTVDTVKDVAVSVLKIGVGCAIGAIFGGIGCLIGAGIGAIAAGIEAAVDNDDSDSKPVDDATKAETERDHPPDENNYGRVLVPQTLTATLDDAAHAQEVRPWAETPDKHRVDKELQIWWPGQREDPGYQGRWGVMCQSDPNDRRSGIVFPNFRRAFLIDLAIHLSN